MTFGKTKTFGKKLTRLLKLNYLLKQPSFIRNVRNQWRCLKNQKESHRHQNKKLFSMSLKKILRSFNKNHSISKIKSSNKGRNFQSLKMQITHWLQRRRSAKMKEKNFKLKFWSSMQKFMNLKRKKSRLKTSMLKQILSLNYWRRAKPLIWNNKGSLHKNNEVSVRGFKFKK